MYSVELLGGKRFPAKIGETLLDAASRSGVQLNYSCKTGRCGTCRCKVLSGITSKLLPETGLTEQEMSDGWILSCVRSTKTDILLEVGDLGETKFPASKTWPCRISEINHVTPDVAQILLRLPPTSLFDFVPGQYIDVIGPGGVSRSYSIANYNFAEKYLELHVRAIEGGAMSQYWFKQAKKNDLLRFNGPMGTFSLRQTSGVDLIFLATGTGIAPVKAMLESISYLEPERKPISVTVLWGGRQSNDLYFDPAEIPGDFVYIPVQSRPDGAWTGAKGYVQDVLLDSNPNLKNAAVYACGSNAMIHSAKTSLFKAGLSPERFYSDAFVSSGMN